MFHSPRPKVMGTPRGALLWKLQQAERAQSEMQLAKDAKAGEWDRETIKTEPLPHVDIGMKQEQPRERLPAPASSTSTAARKRMTELKVAKAEAALALAKIEATIAAEEESLRGDKSVGSSERCSRKVTKWLDHSTDMMLNTTFKKEPHDDDNKAESVKNVKTQIQPCAMLTQTSKDAPKATQDTRDSGTEKEIGIGFSKLLTRLATSKDLPHFYGDPLEFRSFKQAYMDSTNMCHFNDAENMWRLRKSLKGDAKEAVASLLMSSVTPSEVIQTLELQFGRPENVINKVVAQIKKLPTLPQAYHAQIVNFAIKIKNCATAARTMDPTYLHSPELVNNIVMKLPSTLISKWADYLFEHQMEGKPKMELMADFLYCEANKTAAAGISHINMGPQENSFKKKFVPYHQTLVVNASESCKFCRKHAHELTECRLFKRAIKPDRWRCAKKNRLCYQCLLPGHTRTECSTRPCEICDQAHHKLLHSSKVPKDSEKDTKRDAETETINEETIANTSTTNAFALLKMVHVEIKGPNGLIPTHALLDDGATVTLIAADLAAKAGLHGKTQTLRLRGALDNSEMVCQTEIVEFSLTTREGDEFEVLARKINELKLPTQAYVDPTRFNHLRELKDCLQCGHHEISPQLLIGQDNYHLIAPKEIVMGSKNQPHATLTPLGWCMHGRVCNVTCDIKSRDLTCDATAASNDVVIADVLHISETHDRDDVLLHEEVRRHFEFESIGVSLKPRVNKLEKQAVAIVENSMKLLDNNQWEVGLPWKDEHLDFQDSFASAAKRLKSVEKKMAMNEEYAGRYKDRVKHLFDNDFARKVNDDESPTREWYLPHFGVDNPKKKKLRLVFDAAAKSRGYSLNDYLLQGPDLLQSLLGVMLRFREKPVGVVGDIKDMFLRVKIRPEDQYALQFLWRDGDRLQPIEKSKYAMTSLIFGANCSPFIAQFVKNTNAQRFAEAMPDGVEAVLKAHYMDDYIQSHVDEATASRIVHEVTHIHKQGGFEIRNWVSNSKEVLATMPKASVSNDAVWLSAENHAERTLGMLWYPSSDEFGFDMTLERIPKDILNQEKQPTKREVLRITMSIFDVYGLLAPFIVTAKIILQEIWKSQIGWDQNIPTHLFMSFNEWLLQLKTIGGIRIPRWYFPNKQDSLKLCEVSNLQLHVFCDASPAAFAAVAYWRLTREDGTISVAFIASKSRVAPVRPTSVPRLELQAAVLGCRLASTIELEHSIKATERYLWTDSSTVLHWIRNECRTYQTFVANRLGEIDTLSRINEWHYVPTAQNVADAATKKNHYQLSNDCEWFRGPTFLRADPKTWLSTREPETKIDEKLLEKAHTILLVTEADKKLPIPQPERFSSWMRLLRATASVLLFIEKCKKTGTGSVDCDLLRRAENILVSRVQSDSYEREIRDLKEEGQVSSTSKLRTLTPFLDNKGLLRVGGRIDAVSDVANNVKAPVILDGQHHITRLIVKRYHETFAHANNETVVNELRQNYWITRLRPTVRTVAARCQECRIRKAKPSPPRLGDLPEARLTHHQRAFTCTGLDLFGPMDVTIGRRREKRYGVIFTCLSVRAVHIEVVHSLTTDALIMALRRMAARRGWPKHLYSDNGTNLRGADAEIAKCKREIDEGALREYGANNDMKWHFIPPLSPNMAGAWERLIRSVKTALKVVLKERAPKEEILNTLLAEVENLVNSRPLTHVSVDPTSDEALTPNHFLLGASSPLPALGAFDDADLYLRKNWRTAQRLTDMYWQRWLKEVLPALLPRQKWTQEGHHFKNGDLVFVVDPNNPRNTWPRGRVVKTFPGDDGRVRVVEIMTKTGTMKRPANRLAPLPTDEECSRSTAGEDVGDGK